MPEEEVPSLNEVAGGEAVDGGTLTVVHGSATATTEKKVEEGRKKWFKDMRGWIMVLAVQVASFTYQAGLNPPHFSKPEDNGKGRDDAKESTKFRSKVFFCSNTTAFLTSLAIIILLMNRSFYRSLAKVTVLEIIVVLDMVGLMAAYWAGSTCDDQTNVFALVLTALLLFIIYVVYTVQLVRKLYQKTPVPAVPARAATGDDDHDSPPPPKEQDIINDGTRAAPTLDVGQAKSELRRRDSRLLARTPGKSAMMSP